MNLCSAEDYKTNSFKLKPQVVLKEETDFGMDDDVGLEFENENNVNTNMQSSIHMGSCNCNKGNYMYRDSIITATPA